MMNSMASRYRSLSRTTINFLKSSSATSAPRTAFSSFHAASQPSSMFSRPLCQIAALQSMFPLHSAVSSARLTSCLSIDSKSSRSLSQELGLSVPR
ncbi:hypothetical protein Leryth_014508 [Lithospermum erythrorhizon]|nr:hypothetical protein Leryth_014508 [Lithospermum erythrorhizon]